MPSQAVSPAYSAVRAALCAALLWVAPQMWGQIGAYAGGINSQGITVEQPYLQSQAQFGQASTQATTVDHLHGVVVSSVDGKPVARVLVTTGDQRLGLLTDSEGRFAFDLRRPVRPSDGSGARSNATTMRDSTTLNFLLRKPGYMQAQAFAQVPMFTPAGPEAVIRLTITPMAAITGQITTDNGTLPSGMNLQLRRKQVQDGTAVWMQVAGAQLNTRGEFRFAELQPGEYKLTAPAAMTQPFYGRQNMPDSVPGFRAVFYPEADSLATATPIHVDAGQKVVANLSLHSTTFYRVTVPVNLPEGAPAGGIFMTPGEGGPVLAYDAKSGVMQGLAPPGAYDFHMNSGGPNRMTGFAHVNVARSPVTTAPVSLHASASVEVIVHREFTQADSTADMPPQILRMINGQAGQMGQPQARPSVSVGLQPVGQAGMFGANLAPFQPGDNPDDLHLQNVTAGTFRVTVNPAGRGYVADVSSGQTNLLRDPLVIGADGHTPPIHVTLRDDAASLEVSLETTAPPQSADSPQALPPTSIELVGVQCIPIDEPERTAQMAVFAQGPLPAAGTAANFRQISNLAPGRYLVIAAPFERNLGQANLEYRNPEVLKKAFAKGKLITLSAGEKAQIQVPVVTQEELDKP